MEQYGTALALAAIVLFVCASDALAADTISATSPDDRSCATQPDLSSAQPIPLDADKETSAKFDAATPCWQPLNGVKSPYAVFLLPQSTGSYIVSITSEPWKYNLVAPHVLVLDGQGNVLREINNESFLFHGSSLYSAVRAHADERYLVVAADMERIGKQVQIISDSTNTYAGAAGQVYFSIHTGDEANTMLTYAGTGTIKVTAQLLPAAK